MFKSHWLAFNRENEKPFHLAFGSSMKAYMCMLINILVLGEFCKGVCTLCVSSSHQSMGENILLCASTLVSEKYTIDKLELCIRFVHCSCWN